MALSIKHLFKGFEPAPTEREYRKHLDTTVLPFVRLASLMPLAMAAVSIAQAGVEHFHEQGLWLCLVVYLALYAYNSFLGIVTLPVWSSVTFAGRMTVTMLAILGIMKDRAETDASMVMTAELFEIFAWPMLERVPCKEYIFMQTVMTAVRVTRSVKFHLFLPVTRSLVVGVLAMAHTMVLDYVHRGMFMRQLKQREDASSLKKDMAPAKHQHPHTDAASSKTQKDKHSGLRQRVVASHGTPQLLQTPASAPGNSTSASTSTVHQGALTEEPGTAKSNASPPKIPSPGAAQSVITPSADVAAGVDKEQQQALAAQQKLVALKLQAYGLSVRQHYKQRARPLQHALVQLRLPDADPSDMGPGGLENALQQIETKLPAGWFVVGGSVRRGSLLLDLDLMRYTPEAGQEDRGEAAACNTQAGGGHPPDRQLRDQLLLNLSPDCVVEWLGVKRPGASAGAQLRIEVGGSVLRATWLQHSELWQQGYMESGNKAAAMQKNHLVVSPGNQPNNLEDGTRSTALIRARPWVRLTQRKGMTANAHMLMLMMLSASAVRVASHGPAGLVMPATDAACFP